MGFLMDLHIHSHFSDGDLSPLELVEIAEQNNVGVISITDHNTIMGNMDLRVYSPNKNIMVISGIEMTAMSNVGKMHILGYDIDIDNIGINEVANEEQSYTKASMLLLIDQLRYDFGIIFNSDDLDGLFAIHNLGKHHIAALLVKMGLADFSREAFHKFINSAYEKIRQHRQHTPHEKIITAIINSGGIPVMAHPKSLCLQDDELFELIKKMSHLGLGGIEVYHPTHTLAQTDYYKRIADELNLLVSGGSDFHGVTFKPDIELGRGKNNNIRITRLSLLDRILENKRTKY